MEPIPAPGESSRPARRILLAAALIQLLLFAVESRGSFAALVSPRPHDPADTTGPFGKGSDCMGYYAWLRSPLLDGDFQFDDEFAGTFARVPGSEAAMPWTPTGHRPNPWPVGPALAWAPAVVLVHLVLSGLGRWSPWPADGYSAPYQLAVGVSTLALSVLTLVLAYRLARRFAGPTPAAAAAAVVILGTPVVAYGAVEVGCSHGPASAALAGFVLVWLRTLGSRRSARWAAVGGLLGVACLMRPQLATYALLPALEAAWLAGRATTTAGRAGAFGRLAVAGLASAAAFAPQLAGKYVLYGDPLGGIHQTAHNWLAPSFGAVLTSSDRGLFYWSPVTVPAVAGLAWLAARRGRSAAAAILACGVGGHVYAFAAIFGGDVYLGWSFGFRFLTETCVLLVPGAAGLLGGVNPRLARGFAVAGGLLVGWNLLLLGAYRHHVAGVTGGTPVELLGFVWDYIRLRPLDAIGTVAAAGWLTRVLAGGFRPEPAGTDAEVVPSRRLAA